MKIKFAGLFFLLLPGFLFAQSLREAKEKIYRCYIYDQSDQWVNAISAMKAATDESVYESLELVEAQYAYIGYCLSMEKGDKAERYISDTQDILKRIIKKDSKNARANSLYGALIAMEMGRNPAKSIYLGPRSISYIEKGRTYNPKEPVAWVEEGNFRFHAPRMFGGSKEKALSSFKKAVDLFEAQSARKKNNWIYLHALVWLAKSYEALDKNQEALAVYQRALAYQPGFTWVKDELLPELKKKM